MAIMQPGDNWIWLLCEAALIVLSIVAVCYLVRIGGDRNSDLLERGTSTIVRYGDGLEEDRAPIPGFLIGTYVVVGGWALLYLLWTGIEGLF